MAEVILQYGSNLGNSIQTLEVAIDLTMKQIGSLVKKSGIYNSQPWGFESKNIFFNQVVSVESKLSPFEILDNIQQIELFLGRNRLMAGYTDRPIDIDILFYNNDIINNTQLQIPHPLLHLRRFVLVPLCEIYPQFIHPVLELSMSELLSRCPDKSAIEKVN